MSDDVNKASHFDMMCMATMGRISIEDAKPVVRYSIRDGKFDPDPNGAWIFDPTHKIDIENHK